MSRAPALAALLGALIVTSSACPDPCVLFGRGCNTSSDCAPNEVCRVSRDFEAFGCALVQGTCISGDAPGDDNAPVCGSVDDCDDELECCDPRNDRCVFDWAYDGPDCDRNTCGDCNDSAFGDRCTDNDDCNNEEFCDLPSFFSDEGLRGICRRTCSTDEACALAERCNGSFCSVPIGTPCRIDGDDELQCRGLTCVDLDAGDRRTNDAYCTGFCTDGGSDLCPGGFVCNDDALECRRL